MQVITNKYAAYTHLIEEIFYYQNCKVRSNNCFMRRMQAENERNFTLSSEKGFHSCE